MAAEIAVVDAFDFEPRARYAAAWAKLRTHSGSPTRSTAAAAAVATASARGSAFPTSSDAEDDHPPGDEPRILAAFEHHGEVVERRVGVEPRVALIHAEM